MAFIRSLRLVLLLGLAALICGVLFSLSTNARPAPAAPAEEDVVPVSGNRLAQQAVNVEIVRTRRGMPTLRMKADQSRSYVGGRIELSQVALRLMGPEGEETLVEAPEAASLSGQEASPAAPGRARQAPAGLRQEIGSWRLAGGVTVTGGGGLVLTTPALAYFESESQARTPEPVSFTRGSIAGSATGMTYDVREQVARFQHQVIATVQCGGMGLVTVQAESASHDLRRGNLEMLAYHASTQRGELLSGTRLLAFLQPGGGIERLEGDQGFLLESTHPITPSGPRTPLSRLLALEGRRQISGERLAVVFNQQSEPTSMEIAGNANLSAGGGEGAAPPSSVAAQNLVFDLLRGSVTHARAAGGVNLKGAPAEGESTGLHMESENLEATLDPNLGSIVRVEGEGEIHLTDQGIESEGSRTYLDPNSDIWTLWGGSGAPASTTWQDRKIQAQRIELDRRHKTLSARGEVKASYDPPPVTPADKPEEAGGALPFFSGGDTIYAIAGSLTFSEQGRVAHYQDRVRLWQGENRVEAVEVDLDESRGTLQAKGDVISTFRQPPPKERKGPGSPSDDIVTVSAAAMSYDRPAGRIHYTGRVLVTQGPMRFTADSMMVWLDSSGHSAQRMEAAGSVEMRDQGRIGKGDKLVVDVAADTLTLSGSGREASVQDESGQQVVRGVSLTMDKSGDRILVESEVGGRTWINLKPRQKGAPALAPDPHY